MDCEGPGDANPSGGDKKFHLTNQRVKSREHKTPYARASPAPFKLTKEDVQGTTADALPLRLLIMDENNFVLPPEVSDYGDPPDECAPGYVYCGGNPHGVYGGINVGLMRGLMLFMSNLVREWTSWIEVLMEYPSSRLLDLLTVTLSVSRPGGYGMDGSLPKVT